MLTYYSFTISLNIRFYTFPKQFFLCYYCSIYFCLLSFLGTLWSNCQVSLNGCWCFDWTCIELTDWFGENSPSTWHKPFSPLYRYKLFLWFSVKIYNFLHKDFFIFPDLFQEYLTFLLLWWMLFYYNILLVYVHVWDYYFCILTMFSSISSNLTVGLLKNFTVYFLGKNN